MLAIVSDYRAITSVYPINFTCKTLGDKLHEMRLPSRWSNLLPAARYLLFVINNWHVIRLEVSPNRSASSRKRCLLLIANIIYFTMGLTVTSRLKYFSLEDLILRVRIIFAIGPLSKWKVNSARQNEMIFCDRSHDILLRSVRILRFSWEDEKLMIFFYWKIMKFLWKLSLRFNFAIQIAWG